MFLHPLFCWHKEAPIVGIDNVKSTRSNILVYCKEFFRRGLSVGKSQFILSNRGKRFDGCISKQCAAAI